MGFRALRGPPGRQMIILGENNDFEFSKEITTMGAYVPYNMISRLKDTWKWQNNGHQI